MTEGLRVIGERHGQRQFHRMYPEETQTDRVTGQVFHARHLYPRHMEFFDAGREYRERCFMAGNRIGKTYGAGGYETACHATGLYPDWWTGRRFARPVRAWVAGKTNETTRDIIQSTLFGEVKARAGHNAGGKGFTGTGVIPGECLGVLTWKQGVADLADVVRVRHVSGGWSTIGLKSYVQGRGSFEGTSQHLIWLDEEPPLDVYGECLIRTATTDGIVMLTFTPLAGLSATVMQFMPKDVRPE